MPVRQSIQRLQSRTAMWRNAMHKQPGTAYEETFAASLVATQLTKMGIRFESGIGKTGIVGIIEGTAGADGPTIALRGDMDALPIQEIGHPHKPSVSKIRGKMHACGHDGHTAILLGTAAYLQKNRNFRGRVLLVFQPAEEGFHGAERMMDDGLFTTPELSADEFYGLHNWPGLPLGQAGLCAGPFMAAVDRFDITVTGMGGHGGMPKTFNNPLLPAAKIVLDFAALNRMTQNPLETIVVTPTNNHGGEGGFAVVPPEAKLIGTMRTFSRTDYRTTLAQMRSICRRAAKDFKVVVDFKPETLTIATVNRARHTAYAAQALRQVLGSKNVNDRFTPVTGGDDMAYFFKKVPGAFFFMGQGTPDSTHPNNQALHNPAYDFNNGLLPLGIETFVTLTENFFARRLATFKP